MGKKLDILGIGVGVQTDATQKKFPRPKPNRKKAETPPAAGKQDAAADNQSDVIDEIYELQKRERTIREVLEKSRPLIAKYEAELEVTRTQLRVFGQTPGRTGTKDDIIARLKNGPATRNEGPDCSEDDSADKLRDDAAEHILELYAAKIRIEKALENASPVVAQRLQTELDFVCKSICYPNITLDFLPATKDEIKEALI